MFESIRLVLESFDNNVKRGMSQEEAEEILAMDCWTLEQFPVKTPEHIHIALEGGWIDPEDN